MTLENCVTLMLIHQQIMFRINSRTNDEGWNTIFKDGWDQLNSGQCYFSVGRGKKNVSTNIIEAIKYVKNCKSKDFGVVEK